MKILQVAYPYEAVSPDSAGGTEQVVAVLDGELTRAGHESVVIARAGSRVRGRLVVGAPADADYATSCRAQDDALDDLLARERFDVVHNQGSTVQHRRDPLPAPLLTTIHLARALYPTSPVVDRPGRFYNLVSESQRAEHPSGGALPVVANGIDVDRFAPAPRREGFALAIGRVCPEKGFHAAIAAAALAGVPLVIVGKVYRFPSHEAYFAAAIAPHLGDAVRFVSAPPVGTKRALLASARCVLIASEIAETSSLVAMEAAASGTPVVCFRRGALPEIVADGVTGWIVDDVAAMARAIAAADAIDPAACRARACERFSATAMAARYIALYRALAASPEPANSGRYCA